MAVQTWRDDLKIAYSDDPDPDYAGHGMVCFPLVKHSVSPDQDMLSWWMSPAEQSAILFLLEHLRPKLSIEIGTQFGGSLQAIAKYSDRVYSLDLDANVAKQLNGYFQNVEYLTGYSDHLLPQLVDTLQKGDAPLSFVLIDGGHSTDEVRNDINHLLNFHPRVPLYILMHDSFNPDCRKGMRTANWADNAYVHAVELDFVAGTINATPNYRNQMWGGLALAILLPEERKRRFEITARAELTFQAASRAVSTSLSRRAARHARRFIGHLPMMRKLYRSFIRSDTSPVQAGR
jgi:methyltransferase family protein